MSVLIDQHSRFIIQGITGNVGRFSAREGCCRSHALGVVTLAIGDACRRRRTPRLENPSGPHRLVWRTVRPTCT